MLAFEATAHTDAGCPVDGKAKAGAYGAHLFIRAMASDGPVCWQHGRDEEERLIMAGWSCRSSAFRPRSRGRLALDEVKPANLS